MVKITIVKGYTVSHKSFPSYNKILFLDSEFIENEAKYGGGVAFYSSDSTYCELNNMVEFNNCTWESNIARF